LPTAELYEISARGISRYAASQAAKVSHIRVTVDLNSVWWVQLRHVWGVPRRQPHRRQA